MRTCDFVIAANQNQREDLRDLFNEIEIELKHGSCYSRLTLASRQSSPFTDISPNKGCKSPVAVPKENASPHPPRSARALSHISVDF